MEQQNRKVPTSLTLAPDLLARLSAAAVRLDRSRSWLASQAIEQFLQNTEMPAYVSAKVLAAAGIDISRGDKVEVVIEEGSKMVAKIGQPASASVG